MSDDLSPAGTPPPANRGKQPGRKQPVPAPSSATRGGDSQSGGDTPKQSAEGRWREKDEKLDEALKGTFPASDPFSIR